MTTNLSTMLLPIALLTTALSSYSQQPAERRYLTVLSAKVAPDQMTAFTDFYKTGAGAKTVSARLKADPNMLRWTLLRAVYPGDPAPAANFLIAVASNGAVSEPDPAKRDALFRAAADMDYTVYMQKVRTMSENLGSTLSHIHEMTSGYSTAEGDYIVVRRLKAAEGKGNAVGDLKHDVTLAIANESVKAGTMKGWSYSHLTFPTGTSLPYDSTDVSVYKDLDSAIPRGAGASAAMTMFGKLFPNKNYTDYVQAQRELAKVVRTDLYRVVAAYRQ